MKGVRSSQFPRVKTATFWSTTGKMVRIYPGTKTKRLYAKLRGGNYARVYFKVEYGKAKTESGKLEMFYNDGEYTDPQEAYKALQAFLE